MVSMRTRQSDEILRKLYRVRGSDNEITEDYTRIKSEYIWRNEDDSKLAPTTLIPKLKSSIFGNFFCIDFDFLNPSAKYLNMKYGISFEILLHSVEQHFTTFFDESMLLSKTGVYFAMSLNPSNELSAMTRSVIIPQTDEATKIFPDILSYNEYSFVNFCDEAEVQLNRNLRQIMKRMVYSAELGDDLHMDLTTNQMLPDKDDADFRRLAPRFPKI